MSAWNEEELEDLADAYVDGSLDRVRQERLEKLLLSDERARIMFLGYLDVHAGLLWSVQRGRMSLDPIVSPDDESGMGGSGDLSWWRSGGVFRTAMAIAALLMVGFAGVLWVGGRGEDSAFRDPGSLLKVSQCLHGSLSDGSELRKGMEFPARRFELRTGLVEFRAPSGTVLLLQGPADFEILDGMRGRLYSGNVVVRMPKGRSGFVVETPEMRVIDLGTEFGVGVGVDGKSRVQVFDGKVRAESSVSGGTSDLIAGEALRSGKEGKLEREIAGPHAFVRRFPTQSKDRAPGGPLFNLSTLSSVQVAAAVKPIAVDGDLSEWKDSQPFRSACAPPYSKTYFLEGRMMYDALNLYLAGHVGDPDPMCNQADGILEFAGGSVIVRVSTDRTLGWPLKGSLQDARNKNAQPLPDSLSERVTSLILSHDKRTDRARLRLQHSFAYHSTESPEEGWAGKFRRDPDGLGYSFEYAIPWRLLHCADDPPRAGDKMAALWMVHWSDAKGLICRGQLVDVTAPQAPSKAPIPPSIFYQYGKTWGRAEYLPAR